MTTLLRKQCLYLLASFHSVVSSIRVNSNAGIKKVQETDEDNKISTRASLLKYTSSDYAEKILKNQENSYYVMQTASFNIKFINDKNIVLNKFLKDLIPRNYLNYRERRNNHSFINTIQNKVTMIQSQGGSPLASKRAGAKNNSIAANCKTLDDNCFMGSTLKNRVINEIWKNRKTADVHFLENAKSKEELMNLIAISLLNDGSILVKPIVPLPEREAKASVEKEEHSHRNRNGNNCLIKPYSENKMQRAYNTTSCLSKETYNQDRSSEDQILEIKQSDINKMHDSKNAIRNQIKHLMNDRHKETNNLLSVKKCKETHKNKGKNKCENETLPPPNIITPCKISKISWEYEAQVDNECNIAIKNLNALIHGIKTKDQQNGINEIMSVIHTAKLSIHKVTTESLQCKEIISKIKQLYVMHFNDTMIRLNSMIPLTVKGDTLKYYVGKGNNSALVKYILKQRPWWVPVEKENLLSANIVWTQLINKKYMQQLPCIAFGVGNSIANMQFCNHIENHHLLSNKKSMFLSLKQYYSQLGIDPYKVLPLTFHIKSLDCPELESLTQEFEKLQNLGDANIWIIKPGENTNRGNGITVSKSIQEIKSIIKTTEDARTNIIQKYIAKPLLINKRKFDIRCYAMLTSINGMIKGYYYSEGYVRTSCKEFSIKNLSNRFIHLTNDAIQKNNEEYGKYETGNKLSYYELQNYLDSNYSEYGIDIYKDIGSQIKVLPLKGLLSLIRLKLRIVS